MQNLPFIHNSKRLACQQGAAIVEFALVLTLLITLMAGIFEFGRAFWYYDALTKATRDGARLMSVASKVNLTTAVTGGVALTQAHVVEAVTAAGVTNFTQANVEVTCLNTTFTVDPCTDGNAPKNVRVQIVNYSLTIGQFIPFLLGANSNYTTNLSPHTTMRYMPEVL